MVYLYPEYSKEHYTWFVCYPSNGFENFTLFKAKGKIWVNMRIQKN